VAKPGERVEVVIDSERDLVTYPTVGQAFHTVNVNYHRDYDVVGTLFLPVTDWFKERTAEFLKQLAAEKGGLYDEYVKKRDQAIREDLDKKLAAKPRTVKV